MFRAQVVVLPKSCHLKTTISDCIFLATCSTIWLMPGGPGELRPGMNGMEEGTLADGEPARQASADGSPNSP